MQKFPKTGEDSPLSIAVFSMEEDNYPVAFQRLVGPIRTMEKSGKLKLDFYSAQNPDQKLSRLLHADLIVIHRDFAQRKHSQKILGLANSLSIPVVFEMDDLLFNLPTSHPHWKYFKLIQPDLIEILKRADFITVSTNGLKEEIQNINPDATDNIFVLPSCIDTEIWGENNQVSDLGEGPYIIGWSGTPTHEEDLDLVVPAIKEILERYPGRVEFKFWGFLPHSLKGLPGITLERGLIPNFIQHAHEMRSSKVHLAIAPLTDTTFNQCKTNVKWMEYSICSIPGIYSQVRPYENVEHGITGWLVDNRRGNWVEAIETFIFNDELRKQIAERAHQEVIKKHLLSSGALNWYEVYKKFFTQFRASHPPLSPMEKGKAKYQVLFEEGNQLLACEMFSLAIKDYEECLALQPASQDARKALTRSKSTFEASKALKTGLELRKKKLFSEAAQHTAQAIHLSPTWTKAICVHAQSLSDIHSHQEAAQYYQLIVNEAPLNWELRVRLSDEYRMAGLIDIARQEFAKARLFAYNSKEIISREKLLNLPRRQKQFELADIHNFVMQITTSQEYQEILQNRIDNPEFIDELDPALQVYLEVAISKKDMEMSRKISEIITYIHSLPFSQIKNLAATHPSAETILENILNGSDLTAELKNYEPYFSQDLLDLIHRNTLQARIHGDSELVDGLEALGSIIANAMRSRENKHETDLETYQGISR